MKKVYLLATGGTIASRPGKSGALAPAIAPEELLSSVPELAEVCSIETRQLYDLDSTNMGPEQWKGIVRTIRDRYEEFDGFVITHGTDTMAYTAAALSYMIAGGEKPIVLTGSQKSVYMRDTDARNNLLRAFTYAADDNAWGVQIVFDNKVILGTRARKVRSKSFDAFSSIDWPETAVFRDTRLIVYFPRPVRPPVRFYTELEPAVFVLKLLPGMTAAALDALRPYYRALVIEGFGVGGLPDGRNGELIQAVEDWLAEGKSVVFSTQVQHEGSDLSVYEVGRVARELPGVLEAKDMTPEAIVTKLMWALGRTRDVNEARALFERPVQMDRL